MTIWIDAQISPQLCPWISQNFDVEVHSVFSLGLHEAEDGAIFEAARQAGAVVLSKDQDFVDLVLRQGPPPQIIWVTCGNTSNQAFRILMHQAFPKILELLRSGEPLVELSQEASRPSEAL